MILGSYSILNNVYFHFENTCKCMLEIFCYQDLPLCIDWCCNFQWEVKAPMPSPCFRAICKQTAKLHEAIVDILPQTQVRVSGSVWLTHLLTTNLPEPFCLRNNAEILFYPLDNKKGWCMYFCMFNTPANVWEGEYRSQSVGCSVSWFVC